VLFVCTKPQLSDVVRAEAERCGSHYVTERWLGGMLTNFQTIKKNIRRLKELERGMEENAFEFYTKKEKLLMDRERTKLDRYLSGIKDMGRLPSLVFVVDAKKEEIAVKEANRLNIPVVAIADTNADPDYLTIPIAGNDDAIRSVQLITGVIADEIERARSERPDAKEGAGEQGAYTYSSDVGESEAAGSRKKRPKRRPRPDVIRRRRHATDEEAGEPAQDAEAADADGGGEVAAATEAAEAAETAEASHPAPEAAKPKAKKSEKKPEADPEPAGVTADGDGGDGDPDETREEEGSP
jgi:small subunit ribosomal protein S2